MAYTFSNDSSVESCDTFSAKFPPNFVLFPNSIRVGSNRIHSFSNAREQYRLICQLVKGNNACSCIMHHIAYSEMGIVRGKIVAASSFAKFSHRFRKFELLVRSLIRCTRVLLLKDRVTCSKDTRLSEISPRRSSRGIREGAFQVAFVRFVGIVGT